MAEAKKIKYTSILTPVGIAIWPKLNAPDFKFKKETGEFGVKLKLSAEDAQPLIDKYEAELAAYFEGLKADLMKGDGKDKAKARALKLAADKPYKDDIDEETGDPTGNIVFNFKMPHKIAREGKADLLLYPDIFDSSGTALKKPPEIWGGSKLQVAGQLRPFNTTIGVGLSMRLQAVMIVELVSKGQRDAGGYGFGATEGGYTADDIPEGTPDSSDDDSDAGATSTNPDF